MIDKKIYSGTVGLNFIQDPALAFVTIMKVARNNKVFKKINTTPTGGDINFKYTSSDGKVLFSADLPFDVDEKVFVKYKV